MSFRCLFDGLELLPDLDSRRTSGIHVDRAAELRPSRQHGGQRAFESERFVGPREVLERCPMRNELKETPVGGQPEIAPRRCGRARAILGLIS